MIARKEKPTAVDIFIHNGLIVAMDDISNILYGGALAINEGRIVVLGPTPELAKQFVGRKTIDAGHQAVLPGLVNTHHHFLQNFLKGAPDHIPFPDWIDQISAPLIVLAVQDYLAGEHGLQYHATQDVRMKQMSEEIFENLKKAVIEYDPDAAAKWARRALEEEIDPVAALQALTEAIRYVGDLFGRGELWLPDLIAASETMSVATEILEEEIRRTGAKQKSLGVVVIGTVAGDIHDIGKNMVGTLLKAGGFEVHDLGVNIQANDFVKAIDKYDAQILALSALLTTTASQQRKVIELLKEKGVRDRVKVMVGGGGITEDFAKGIGADGYDPTAPGAVNLARRFVGR